MSRLVHISPKQSKLGDEPRPSSIELAAHHAFEMARYGYHTGFDASLALDCQWLRGYRFAMRQQNKKITKE